MTTTHRYRLKPVTALIATLAAGSTFAQDAAPAADTQALGAVTVRSRNRIEKLQDVPLSISVIQGAELDRLGAVGIDDITKRAANVSWNLGNQRTSSISIRGIGKIGQTEAQDPSVGIIVDGVSYAYNALTSSFDFVDIDTIEVTRGPQGTLLGKNASVGNVIFTTKRPSFTPTADFTLGFRQRDGLFATAAVGGPVVDGLIAWRGTFSANKGAGDIKNAYNRDISYTNTDRISGRVQFLITPSPDFKARIAFDLQPRAGETTNGRALPVVNPPTTYSNGAPITTLTNEQRLARRWFKDNTGYSLADYQNVITTDSVRGLVTGSAGATADLNWQLGSHTLTSITAWKSYHFDAVNDDATPFDVYRNAGGFWNDYRQASQELRLTSAPGGFVDYQAGLYFIKVDNTADYRRWWGNDAGAWFASNAQYARLDADGAGRDLLRNSLANVRASYNSPTGVQDITNKSAAIFAQANWHLSDALTLTTGARLTREDRRNVGTSRITSNGSAPELNPVSVNGVALGGFATNATGDLAAGNTAEQIALANATAAKYFNVPTYAALTAAQRRQVADAKAIRQTNIGVLFPTVEAEPFKATQPAWVLSPSYKFTRDLTGYASLQHGEKAGIAQFVNGISTPVKAEKTDSFEVGFKSALLNKTLILNADVFLTRIKDYQQSVRVVDAYTTALNNDGTFYYTSTTGNSPKVEVKGIEVDGVYGGIRNLTVRFSAAYNDAKYKSFPNAAQRAEDNFPGAAPYTDQSGKPLAGAAKYTGNVGVDYRQPVWGDKEINYTANVAFSSSYYSDAGLSAYSIVPKSTTVDAGIGFGTRNKAFNVSLIVKNLFDDDTVRSRTSTSYTPAIPRSVGIQFMARL
ncbi:outer membrane receptor protein involved in Fe transport [Pelomonas aquatica]|uniref:Outer membrane receptor protein involved in Fe transport n=1 Tax=Pelomonas aquatica TaxID=431058 RepID=A0ABU1Z275_9BURK|nr:TonB-dependent receptor [Pelomonas aquatica]MDR7294716.1 outer membrane receptor protein involved in Fe transport [Pelomonas aquatica]